jgi:hypothetical protein
VNARVAIIAIIPPGFGRDITIAVGIEPFGCTSIARINRGVRVVAVVAAPDCCVVAIAVTVEITVPIAVGVNTVVAGIYR